MQQHRNYLRWITGHNRSLRKVLRTVVPRLSVGESPQQQNHGAVISRRIIGQSASV